MTRSIAILALPLVLASCTSEPANVAGTYTINTTNGPNECMVENWTEGATTTGVTLVVVQDGSSFTADVIGVGGAYLDLVVGSHTFTGTVSGSHLDGTLRGRGASIGSCAYSIDVDLDADLNGDVLTGTLRWYADTNSSPDCGIYATCSNEQAFNGARPPSECAELASPRGRGRSSFLPRRFQI